jgi:SlyX protein
MDQRIVQLEIKVAYLEEANAQLSDMVYRQRQELESLRTQLAGFAERIEAAREQTTAYTAEQEKPPHY